MILRMTLAAGIENGLGTASQAPRTPSERLPDSAPSSAPSFRSLWHAQLTLPEPGPETFASRWIGKGASGPVPGSSPDSSPSPGSRPGPSPDSTDNGERPDGSMESAPGATNTSETMLERGSARFSSPSGRPVHPAASLKIEENGSPAGQPVQPRSAQPAMPRSGAPKPAMPKSATPLPDRGPHNPLPGAPAASFNARSGAPEANSGHKAKAAESKRRPAELPPLAAALGALPVFASSAVPSPGAAAHPPIRADLLRPPQSPASPPLPAEAGESWGLAPSSLGASFAAPLSSAAVNEPSPTRASAPAQTEAEAHPEAREGKRPAASFQAETFESSHPTPTASSASATFPSPPAVHGGESIASHGGVDSGIQAVPAVDARQEPDSGAHAVQIATPGPVSSQPGFANRPDASATAQSTPERPVPAPLAGASGAPQFSGQTAGGLEPASSTAVGMLSNPATGAGQTRPRPDPKSNPRTGPSIHLAAASLRLERQPEPWHPAFPGFINSPSPRPLRETPLARSTPGPLPQP